MNNKILTKLCLLNQNLIQRNIFLAIIETGKKKECDYLTELELLEEYEVVSNDQIIWKYHKLSYVVENKGFLREFFKFILPNISNNHYNVLFLFKTQNMDICKYPMNKETINFLEFINHRRNHNVSIIMFVNKFEELPKHIRETSDFIIIDG